MLLSLSKLIGTPGSTLDFETSLDLSDLDFGGCCPAKQPVLFRGTVRNTADVLLMHGAVSTRLFGVCARCADAFERDVVFPLDAVLVPELESEENEEQWVFQLVEDCADLDDILTTAFVLNMDTKLLCSPDCKGLCCRCGVNLNHGTCRCQPEKDSRFAVLQQLLDKAK